MTNDEFLQFLRRRLRDVDETAPLYDDDTLWSYTQDALRLMQSRLVIGYTSYSVVVGGNTPGIVPDPLDADAILLAIRAAIMLLTDLYTSRVGSGELGVSWESGLERESTITQQKAFIDNLNDLETQAESLTIIRWSTRSGQRVQ